MYGNTIVSHLKTPLNTTQRSSAHPIPIAATTAPRSVRATTIFPAFWTSIPSPSRPPSVSRHGPNFGPFFWVRGWFGSCNWYAEAIPGNHSWQSKGDMSGESSYESMVFQCVPIPQRTLEPFTPSGTDAGWDPWSRELHPGAPGAVWIMACRSEGWTQPSRQLRWTFEHSTCLVETNLPTP